MDKKILTTATVMGVTAIILGAFAAHALEKILSPDQIQTFETGVKYQIYHALLLLYLGLEQRISGRIKNRVFVLTVIGIILFSGSIYGLATDDQTEINFKTIGFVTPIGGTLLITAWILLLAGLFRSKKF